MSALNAFTNLYALALAVFIFIFPGAFFWFLLASIAAWLVVLLIAHPGLFLSMLGIGSLFGGDDCDGEF